MLKYFVILFLVTLTVSINAQSAWENDPKGLGYHQFYGCQDTTGVKLDSMFRMTDSTGKLSICLSIGDLLDIINNYDGDDGGQGFFGCDSVQYCLENGTLCDVLSDFPTGNYTNGNYLFGIDNGGMCKRLNILNVPGVGDTCRIANNADCSYTFYNENNTAFKFGYQLVCINDSMITLTDWDGTSCGDTCTLPGSGGGGGGGNDFNCDSVKNCISDFLCDSVKACIDDFLCDSVKACLEQGALCEVLSGLEMANTELGDKYVTIKDGECVLTDSIAIDICGIIQEIQEESVLNEDDVAFIIRDNANCFKVPISTRATECITVQIDAGDIIATPIISGNAGNIIQCLPSGFYAAATLAFNCDSLNNLFTPAATADSIFADQGGQCVKIPLPGAALVNCDTIASIFGTAGTLNNNDWILTTTSTGDCERVQASEFNVTCEDLRGIFNSGTSDPDSLLAFKDGSCVRIPTSDINVCEMTLQQWVIGECEEPKIIVQCPTGCRYMTPCDIQDYVCSGLTAPFSPMMVSIDNKIQKEVTRQLSIQPVELVNRASQYDYPTVNNMGLRTFKSKRQAELSDIPIGGMYYIEGGDNIMVKTRQRNK